MTKSDKQKAQAGRPRDPEISRISRKFGVSRARAHQLRKDIADSGGSETNILELRCKRLAQQIEAAELDLAKLRAGEDETIPIKHLREAIELMIIFSAQFARQAASTFGANVAGQNPYRCQEELLRFADMSHYAGVGAALANSSPQLKAIYEDVLQRGDWRYLSGPSLRQATVRTAVKAARNILREAGEVA